MVGIGAPVGDFGDPWWGACSQLCWSRGLKRRPLLPTSSRRDQNQPRTHIRTGRADNGLHHVSTRLRLQPMNHISQRPVFRFSEQQTLRRDKITYSNGDFASRVTKSEQRNIYVAMHTAFPVRSAAISEQRFARRPTGFLLSRDLPHCLPLRS